MQPNEYKYMPSQLPFLPNPKTHSSGGSLALVGLQAPEEGHSIPRLSLQLPVADQFGNELSLLVQAHSADDTVQSEGTGREGGGGGVR